LRFQSVAVIEAGHYLTRHRIQSIGYIRKDASTNGVDVYITKPFSPSGLIAAVQALAEPNSAEERQ
jgi:CheY-like chemotaxis protein